MPHWIIIPAAVSLDLILGDPRWLPHPVRWMGVAIEKLTPRFYNLKMSMILNGGLFWAILVGVTFLIVLAMVAIAEMIHPNFRLILEIGLIYYALSARCLAKEAMGVYHALKENNLPLARSRVAMIVGRETQNLSS
ncbi:MAG: CobD/CbiB family cobalamin biosynthesis protein, partial [Desulfobacteraceae bacterium]